jgi:hypothetical protein
MKRSKWIAGVLMLSGVFCVGRADVITWDGEGGDGWWTNSVNWSGNTLPASGDTINIGNGDTVKFTATGANQNLPALSTLNLTGNSTLTDNGGVIRLNGSTVNAESGSTLTGNFWDLASGSLVLDDGVVANMSFLEHKGNNSFTFNLSASGFTAITPGRLFLTGVTMSNATYNVDFANYAGGDATYTLIDFGPNGAAAITAETMQWATYNALNGDGYTSSLSYDEATRAIQLNVQVIPEPGVLALAGIGGVVLLLRRRRSSR